MERVRALAVLFAVACVASSAHAQPDAAPPPADPHLNEAEQLYAEGSKHYNLREYPQAIDAFKRAYALVPEPTFLFDIAQAYRQQRDCDNALTFYRNYLRAKPDADDRDKVEKLAAEMQTCAEALARDREAERQRQLAAGTPPAPRHNGALRLAGAVTAGVGAIAAGTGVYFSVDANHQAHRLEQACTPRCNATDVASIDSQGKNDQTLAIGLYIGGGLALGAGVGMVVWAMTHASAETITVAPVAGGATVSTSLHF